MFYQKHSVRPEGLARSIPYFNRANPMLSFVHLVNSGIINYLAIADGPLSGLPARGIHYDPGKSSLSRSFHQNKLFKNKYGRSSLLLLWKFKDLQLRGALKLYGFKVLLIREQYAIWNAARMFNQKDKISFPPFPGCCLFSGRLEKRIRYYYARRWLYP